ncbi:MAG: endonuclease/exonuclease/phosphatase family protein [Halioglobus sp.]
MKLFSKSTRSIMGALTALLATGVLADANTGGEFAYLESGLLPQIVESATLNVLTLNVAHARGKALNQILVSSNQHRSNLDKISSMLRDSDAQVVAIQEADGQSLWSGHFDHVGYLAAAAGHWSFVHGYHADSWLFTYGAALMSNFRLSETQSHSFQPSWPTTTKGFVRGSILWRDSEDRSATIPVTLVSIHLDFSRESVRRAQIDELVRELQPIETPLIILGDFNADWSVEDSPVRDLAAKLKLRAFNPQETGLGSYKTNQRLDWILISDRLEFADYRVLPDVLSDHLAVQAKISWKQPD